MKLFKRLCVVAIAVTAVSLLLCGCSEEEMGMFNMLSESYSYEQCILNGVFSSDDAYMDSNGDLVAKYDESYDDIRYTIYVNNSDQDNPYIHAVVEGILFGKAITEPFEIYCCGDKMYLNGNLLEAINDMSYISDVEGRFSDVYDGINSELGEEYFVEFDSDYTDADFIFNYIGGIAYFNNFNISDTILGIGNGNIIRNTSLRKYFEEALRDYNSGFVSETDSGYSLDLNFLNMCDLGAETDEYIYNHKSEAYSAYLNYIEALGIDKNSSVFEYWDNGIAKYSEQEFYDNIDNMYNIHINTIDSGLQGDINNKGYLVLTTSCVEGVYKNTLSDVLDLTPYASVDTTFSRKYVEESITPCAVEALLPEKVISHDVYQDLYDTVNARVNPVIGLEFERGWYTLDATDYGETTDVIIDGRNFKASVHSFIFPTGIRANGVPDALSYKEFGQFSGPGIRFLFDENDSIYIPLRGAAEYLGEEVMWDDTTQEAYILRDGEEIHMDGVLYKPDNAFEDMWYVKVRDFEKLGYTVDYVKIIDNSYANMGTYKVLLLK